MIDVMEELFKLADECREWARGPLDRPHPGAPVITARDVVNEFKRLSDKLDELARQIGAGLPT